jgi:hypothetical protein
VRGDAASRSGVVCRVGNVNPGCVLRGAGRCEGDGALAPRRASGWLARGALRGAASTDREGLGCAAGD